MFLYFFFFFIYIKTFKNLSAKYQENKGRPQHEKLVKDKKATIWS